MDLGPGTLSHTKRKVGGSVLHYLGSHLLLTASFGQGELSV